VEVIVNKDEYLKAKGKTTGWLTERLKNKPAVQSNKKDYMKEGDGATQFRKVIVENNNGADSKQASTLSLLFLSEAQAAHCVAELRALENKCQSSILNC